MGDHKEYRVIISDRAKLMLGTHICFLKQINREAVVSKKKQIMHALRSLSEMPTRYPFFNEESILPNKYHKMYIEKWYIVLYQIQDNTVYVDYILDCRRDYSGLLM